MTIATSKSQVSSIHNQLGTDVGISVEPCRRDTFAAIALATAYLHDVMNVPGDEAVVVCPVDPYVDESYFECVNILYETEQKVKAIQYWDNLDFRTGLLSAFSILLSIHKDEIHLNLGKRHVFFLRLDNLNF